MPSATHSELQSTFLTALCAVDGSLSTSGLLPPSVQRLTRKAKINFSNVYREGTRRLLAVLDWLLRKQGTANEVAQPDPPQRVLELLQFAGIIQLPQGAPNTSAKSFTTTGAGIQLCLSSVSQQVEILVTHCARFVIKDIRNVDTAATERDVVSLCLFLPQLGTDDLYVFPTEEAEVRLLNLLEKFGFITKWFMKEEAVFVYAVHPHVKLMARCMSTPTDPKTQKVSIDKPTASDTFPEGFLHIIVETNFRVYAYCNAEKISFYRSVLSHIVEVQTVVPSEDALGTHLLVCTLTHATATEAFRSGVTAAQVIAFFTTHPHPRAKSKRRVVPETVAQQLVLWEEESRRVAQFSLACDVGDRGWEYHMLRFDTLLEKQTHMMKERHRPDTVVLGEMEDSLSVVVARRITAP